MKTMRLDSLVRSLSMTGSVFGILALVCAISGDRPDFAKLALVLFAVSALSTLGAYWRCDPIGELDPSEQAVGSSNRLIARYDEARFVSLTLAVMLGAISLIWLVMYSSDELPPEVAWFALTVAFFVVTSMTWVAHLGEQLRDRGPRPRRPLPAHVISRHAS